MAVDEACRSGVPAANLKRRPDFRQAMVVRGVRLKSDLRQVTFSASERKR